MGEYNKIYNYIDENFDSHVKAAQALIRQPSVSLVEPGQGKDVFDCAELLKNIIADLGAERAEVVNFPQGFPVVFGRLSSKNPNAKTLIVYALYDVMPAEEENWISPPFEAAIVDAEKIDLPPHLGKCIVGRGAKNQKGPIVSFVNALKSILAVTGDIPVNVMFAIEGEEELGSMNILGPFREQYMDELKAADAAYYINPTQTVDPSLGVKGDMFIHAGNRGIVFMELSCKGGAWGGPGKPVAALNDLWLDSPVWSLIQAIASLRDKEGNVLVEGFYDDVSPLSEEYKKTIEVLEQNLDEAEAYRDLCVQRFKGGRTPKDLYWKVISQPTINIDGVGAGYTGPRNKTLFLNRAIAKMDIRMVPNQDPEDILKKLRKHLDKHGFPQVEINVLAYYPPNRSPFNTPIVDAAVRATKPFGVKPLIWPVYYAGLAMGAFGNPPLNLPTVGCGLGRTGRDHMANEYFTLQGMKDFEKWIVAFLHEFAKM